MAICTSVFRKRKMRPPCPTETLAIEANKGMGSERDHVFFKSAKEAKTVTHNCLKTCLKTHCSQQETFALNSVLSGLAPKAPSHCWGPHMPAGSNRPGQPVALLLCNHVLLHHPRERNNCWWTTNVSWVDLSVTGWSGKLEPADEPSALRAITFQQ